MGFWQFATGGGSGGGSGDVVGPASSTDNAVARFDGATGKLLQDSALTVSDVAGGVVTLATTAGNALAVLNTAPAAAAGASVAGDPLTVTAGAAVASTDTDGAAAGGSVTITGGAAARRNSGNANGGDVLLVGGAGIGTGTQGVVKANGLPVVAGPASATDHLIARFDGATGSLIETSDLQISDLAAGAVILSTTAGTALTIKNTDPAATTGASVAGDALAITAGNAVASTDTAGAAAGGSVTITGGNAARNASGNAAGGDINLVGGTGIGTGRAGAVIVPASSSATAPSIYSTGQLSIQAVSGSVYFGNTTTHGMLVSGSIVRVPQASYLGWSAAADLSTTMTALRPTGGSTAGTLEVIHGTNSMSNNIKIATTTVNASGATSTASNLVPAGCILLGVTTRVTTAITSGDGGTSVNIGNGTDADMYGAAIAFALGTTTNLASHTASALAFVSAAQNVVFTCVGGTFSGGVWRVCAHYLDLSPPSS